MSIGEAVEKRRRIADAASNASSPARSTTPSAPTSSQLDFYRNGGSTPTIQTQAAAHRPLKLRARGAAVRTARSYSIPRRVLVRRASPPVASRHPARRAVLRPIARNLRRAVDLRQVTGCVRFRNVTALAVAVAFGAWIPPSAAHANTLGRITYEYSGCGCTGTRSGIAATYAWGGCPEPRGISVAVRWLVTVRP